MRQGPHAGLLPAALRLPAARRPGRRPAVSPSGLARHRTRRRAGRPTVARHQRLPQHGVFAAAVRVPAHTLGVPLTAARRGAAGHSRVRDAACGGGLRPQRLRIADRQPAACTDAAVAPPPSTRQVAHPALRPQPHATCRQDAASRRRLQVCLSDGLSSVCVAGVLAVAAARLTRLERIDTTDGVDDIPKRPRGRFSLCALHHLGDGCASRHVR